MGNGAIRILVATLVVCTSFAIAAKDDVFKKVKKKVNSSIPNSLQINVHDIDNKVKSSIPEGMKINRHSVEGAVTEAWQQLHDGTVRLGHQNASNWKSVSDYIDARIRGFCETMGPDEDCVEDEVGVQVDNNGKTNTFNSAKGETYPVTRSEEYVDVESLPQLVIVEPGAALQRNSFLQDLSDEQIADPLPLWPVPYTVLSSELQATPNIKAKWDAFVAKYQVVKPAQGSGRVRPMILVSPKGFNVVSTQDVIKTAYDAHGVGKLGKDAWMALVGKTKFSWLKLAGTSVSIILDPAEIREDDLVVLGMYPEEKAALDAANEYYDALPAAVKIEYEKKPSGASIEQGKPNPDIP